MKKTFLYLDRYNSRIAPFDYNLVIIRSYSVFVNYLELEGLPDTISFCFDLGFDKNKSRWMGGLEAAQHLIDYVKENQLPICWCEVHTKDDIEAEKIKNLLNEYSTTHENYQCCRKV